MITSKKNAKTVEIKEQIIWNDASGLTIEFAHVEGTSVPYRLRLYGEILALGNREFCFGESGELGATGTCLKESCPDHPS